jgi:type IV pilus assembly protein PilX
MQNLKLPRRGSPGLRKPQQGVALVIALMLLVLIALVGLAAIRGTVIQQRMAANTYDRQLAFQAAEAALRVGTAAITNGTALNCGPGGQVCDANPFSDTHVPASSIVTLTTTQYQGTSAVAQPQYVIQYLGGWVSAAQGTGFGQTANSYQYDAQGNQASTPYYRVTARSSDPSQSGNRAVVTLQAVVKQG